MCLEIDCKFVRKLSEFSKKNKGGFLKKEKKKLM